MKKLKIKNQKFPNIRRGFVLLFAILITSIVLAISLGIFNIIIKEVQLSASSQESQKAFYAADTGAECALYWDIQGRAFATSSQESITCADESVMVGGGFISDFSLTLANGSCVDVNVDKSGVQTIVSSRGHNTCDINDPRRVERGLRVTY